MPLIVPSIDLSFLWIAVAIVALGVLAEIYMASNDRKLHSKYYNICFSCGGRVDASREVCPHCRKRVLFSSLFR